MSPESQDIYTGIEIGTSTIKVAICHVLEDYRVKILGWGEAPSLKVVKGNIKDANFVSDQIAAAFEKAERSSGLSVSNSFVQLGISGSKVKLQESVGVSELDSDEDVVTEDHMIEANRNAEYHPVDDNQLVLHEYTRYYSLDGTNYLNPNGKAGNRLEAHLHSAVIGKAQFNSYAMGVMDLLGQSVERVIYTPMALGFASFFPRSQTELNDGYLLIDIGAGVTSYVLCTGVDFFTMGQVTVGCDHAANDLSIAFALPIDSTRKMLQKLEELHCSVIPKGDFRNRLITADQGTGKAVKQIPASSVEQIIYMRFLELFSIIHSKIEREDGWPWIRGGILLSGGGARIPRIAKLAEQVFSRPVSIATLKGVDGPSDVICSPANLTPIGLVRVGYQNHEVEKQNHPQDPDGKFKQFVKSLFRW